MRQFLREIYFKQSIDSITFGLESNNYLHREFCDHYKNDEHILKIHCFASSKSL